MYHTKRRGGIHLPKLPERILIMEEQIKNIVSQYTKIPVGQINAQTVIDRSAVASSIILHRMYASLASEGFAIENYMGIKSFGQLLSGLYDKPGLISPVVIPQIINADPVINLSGQNNSIGIDVEAINSMPLVHDFREDEFYKMNFAAAEIAYCVLQPNPQGSFAGLFAAKEAIVKASNYYKDKPFNSIIINHLPNGKPIHPSFQLSISHSTGLAVAVAIFINPTTAAPDPSSTSNTLPPAQKNPTLILFTAITALILSLLALVSIFIKSC